MKTYAEILAARAARARRYRAMNPERKKAANARYYAQHRETAIASALRWREKNRRFIAFQAKQRRAGLRVTPITVLRRLEKEYGPPARKTN